MAQELYVTSPIARQLELFYLNRFDDQVHRLSSLIHPLTGKALPRLPNWKACHIVSDERSRIMDLRRVGALEADFEARFPLNAASRYEIPPPGRREKGLYLEAVAFSRLEAHLKQGYDDRPATVEDMMPLLVGRGQEARDFDIAYAFALASTTGWDENAVRAITDPAEGGFRDYAIFPFLVDLQDKTIHFYRGDARMEYLLPIFAPLTRGERVAALQKRIAERLLTAHNMSDQEAGRIFQETADVIKEAFDALAQDKELYHLYHESGEGWIIALR